MESKWYTVQVITNYEQNVKEALENREIDGDNSEIEEVFVPIIDHITKTGKRRKKSLFPGYVFVKVNMSDKAWYVIRNTQYVTGIVGSSGQRTKPTPVPQSQIDNIIKKIAEASIETESMNSSNLELSKVEFEIGDIVLINSGSFQGKSGEVKEISIEKQTATVELEFFGRKTPITLPLKEVSLR